MLPPDIFRAFLEPLNRLEIRYCVTGSTAGIAYGEPRMTNDIDIVVELSMRDVARFVAAFPLPLFYCPPEEVLALEVRRGQRGHCNLIEQTSGLKADIYLAHDDLHDWALSTRRTIPLHGLDVHFAPPEYVIVRKLMYYREGGSTKHVRDIVGMLVVSGDQISHPRVLHWALRFGLASEWERVLAQAAK
jgi:hypothetical protein